MISSDKPRICVIGAGLVGERHARMVADHPDCTLAAIVDPSPNVEKLGSELNAKVFDSIDSEPSNFADAAIVATPNGDHLRSGVACAARGWPTLIEKPITDTVEAGQRLISEFDKAQVPLLVGHHRRYHPFVDRARRIIAHEEFGKPILASIMWAVRKPDSYFEKGGWRLNAEGGPILINFIHEIDLMLAIFGPVREIQAIVSDTLRPGAAEDTAAISLRFVNGMICTVTLSDAALSPWSFEGACAENPTIAETGISSWRVACSNGAFDFPGLTVWQDAAGGLGDWSSPLKSRKLDVKSVVPLYEQLTHFVGLIHDERRKPVVSGKEGLEALRLVSKLREAIASGGTVTISI